MNATPKRKKKGTYVSRRVGGVRPSQMMHTYGPGAVIDLPGMSVVLAGTDLWDINHSERILEPRLIGAVRAVSGCGQVSEFRTPPWEQESASAFDEWARERDEDEVRSDVAKLGNAVEKFLAESRMSEDELSAAFSPEETED